MNFIYLDDGKRVNSQKKQNYMKKPLNFWEKAYIVDCVTLKQYFSIGNF